MRRASVVLLACLTRLQTRGSGRRSCTRHRFVTRAVRFVSTSVFFFFLIGRLSFRSLPSRNTVVSCCCATRAAGRRRRSASVTAQRYAHARTAILQLGAVLLLRACHRVVRAFRVVLSLNPCLGRSPPCASYGLRVRALKGDMRQYLCCQGHFPCSGSFGERNCPEFCLATEVCCCFPNSVVTTRYLLQGVAGHWVLVVLFVSLSHFIRLADSAEHGLRQLPHRFPRVYGAGAPSHMRAAREQACGQAPPRPRTTMTRKVPPSCANSEQIALPGCVHLPVRGRGHGRARPGGRGRGAHAGRRPHVLQRVQLHADAAQAAARRAGRGAVRGASVPLPPGDADDDGRLRRCWVHNVPVICVISMGRRPIQRRLQNKRTTADNE